MKLTKTQFKELRSSVESVVTGFVESLMEDTMDNYFRDQVFDSITDEEFTEDEVDELREMWGEVEKEGEVDTDRFIQEVTDSIMMKYK